MWNEFSRFDFFVKRRGFWGWVGVWGFDFGGRGEAGHRFGRIVWKGWKRFAGRGRWRFMGVC